MLSSGSGGQLCSPPVVLLWSLFSLCLLTGGLLLCLTPFVWGKVNDLSAGPLLSACDGFLFVFQFCRAIWLWVLLTGSGEELCGPLPALPQAVAYHPPTVGLPAFPTICLLIVHREISSLLLPPSLVHLQHFCPLCCVLVFTSLFIVQFFFCEGGGQSAQGAMLIYPRGGWGNTVWCLVLTCLICWMSPKQVWSWWWQPTCFLSVVWCGETLYGLGVQGIEVLILLSALFLPSVAPVSQEDFGFTELMLSSFVP
jgi:hypothetical protein